MVNGKAAGSGTRSHAALKDHWELMASPSNDKKVQRTKSTFLAHSSLLNLQQGLRKVVLKLSLSQARKYRGCLSFCWEEY